MVSYTISLPLSLSSILYLFREESEETFYTLLIFVPSFPELHDAIFVVGALDETIVLRGMRYHPIDIENSILKCHKKIAEW